ncbi:hypothetical protein QTV49_004575 [Vibrio vulnificus]|nr:hypothetical protein [Vibrio vulnificus]
MSINAVISIYPVSNGITQENIDVTATLENDGCKNITFKSKDSVLILSDEDILKHPVEALSKLAKSLSNEHSIDFTTHEVYGEELVFTIDEYNDIQLILPSSGQYARFTQHGVEIFYWDANEFFEAPRDVMGAVFGILNEYGDVY